MIVREPFNLAEPENAIERIGRKILLGIAEVGRASVICIGAFANMRFALHRRARREIIAQIHNCAIKSLPVVTIVGFFIGMILAVQIGIELSRYNQEALIAPALMVSMLREMGPFMSGLVLAACVGAAMAAQIGTMTVNEELAALEIMSIDPIRFLVMPRMVAMIITVPLISFYTCMVALVGGAVVGMTQLSVPWTTYWTNSLDGAEVRALYIGLFKAFVFGALIATVSCYEGFTSERGAVGVGKATRDSVITNFLMILVLGYFVTRLFY